MFLHQKDVQQTQKDKKMKLRDAAIALYSHKDDKDAKLTIARMAELIEAVLQTNDLPKIKKSLSISTTKWKGFTREKIDGKIHVSYTPEEVVTPKEVVAHTEDKGTLVTFLYDGKKHTATAIKKQGALTQVGSFDGYPDGKYIKTNTILEA